VQIRGRRLAAVEPLSTRFLGHAPCFGVEAAACPYLPTQARAELLCKENTLQHLARPKVFRIIRANGNKPCSSLSTPERTLGWLQRVGNRPSPKGTGYEGTQLGNRKYPSPLSGIMRKTLCPWGEQKSRVSNDTKARAQFGCTLRWNPDIVVAFASYRKRVDSTDSPASACRPGRAARHRRRLRRNSPATRTRGAGHDRFQPGRNPFSA
jgi:hypothetical protein